MWLLQNPSKRWDEVFFLLYTPFWLTLCLGIVVPFKLYENWNIYFSGLFQMFRVPTVLLPMIVVGKADKHVNLNDRYWVKVPHTIFLLALFYLVVSNITLGRLQHAIADLPDTRFSGCIKAGWILLLSYFIAYLETLAIANVCCVILRRRVY